MEQLTQQMIDSMLDELEAGSQETEPSGNDSTGLNDLEIDALAESVNISMGAAAKALSSIFNARVVITTPAVEIRKQEEIEYKSLVPAVVVSIKYITGLNGVNVFVIKQSDVKKISAIMMGMPVPEEDDGAGLDEIQMSAISEVMNQMMGASSTALATFFNRRINISTPECTTLEPNDNAFNVGIEGEYSVVIKINLTIGDMFDGEFINIMPMRFAKDLAVNLINLQLPMYAQTAVGTQQKPEQKMPKGQRSETVMPKNENVPRVEFADFDSENQKNTAPTSNLDLIMDVPLEVIVQIGKAEKQLKDIIKLTQGSIIELEKQAGDPVDILVNGELIARGDVVVIDDNFGVRITEIVRKN